jgi:hypothetical protein
VHDHNDAGVPPDRAPDTSPPAPAPGPAPAPPPEAPQVPAAEPGPVTPPEPPSAPTPEPTPGAPPPGPPVAGPPAPPAWTPPPPPPEAWQRPARVEPVPGSPYGLAILAPPAATSGVAVGSLVAGSAALVVALLAMCLGLAGAPDGWGLGVSGAFAIFAGWLAVGAGILGAVGVRQTRPPTVPGRARPGGRGAAVAGLTCGAVALFLTVCGVAGTVLAQYG